jgi:TPP-dependent pyruvate/acetoin dehydrogenase alpha subunit
VSSDEASAMKRDVLAEVNAVTDEAEALPYPAPAELYKNVYEGAYEPWQ